ncbi:TetR/AcrR family transcriptional regulator [Pseudoxanthomonas sp. CF125]|uniref:TetR/AcrR family transcriptional regulator n=1 Tax=Pseudoxanthomonas sp. CF125 TaxID=1855303 RepID=UPI00087FCDB6|nr:TetR/AcrR family transcriptional regulator [Pseudoxanthomonas sp. CF125]SDQ49917.1 transcriptional regulator, TetR family [Pseudoxanthomonas sp. CF125]
MDKIKPSSSTKPRPVKRASKSTGKPATKKRAPGRPAADSPDLRDRLMGAALACFVRKGIAATSLRDIATEAGVTPALLHYYFGDKDQLQAEVIAQKIIPIFIGLREPLLQAGDDIAALIAGFVSGIGRIVAEHPWLPPLWVREVLCEGGALRDLLFDRIGPQLPQMMAARFAEAQAKGRINPDLDPRLLMVSLVGLTLFPAAGAPIWRRLFNAEDLNFDIVRLHTLALLDRGLELDHAE